MHSFKTQSGFPLLYDWLSTKYGLAALEKGSHEYDYNFGHLALTQGFEIEYKVQKKLPLFPGLNIFCDISIQVLRGAEWLLTCVKFLNCTFFFKFQSTVSQNKVVDVH